jgi:uracil-DNA glycosylase family 4
MEKWSRDWKQEQLKMLKAEWENCQKCPLCNTRKRVVFGEGNPEADIILISEAPGDEEDKCGRPFVGKCGELLNGMLEQVGIDRSTWYITNLVGCRPPPGRTEPLSAEIDACIERVYKIIYTIDPVLIVSAGKLTLQSLVGSRWGVTSERGKLFSSPYPEMKTTGERNGVSVPGKFFPKKGDNKKEYSLDYDLIPIVHPSFLLRDSTQRSDGSFMDGGVAHRTMDDLFKIKTLVDNYNEELTRTKVHYERLQHEP